MSTLRFKALEKTVNKQAEKIVIEDRLSTLFNQNVFSHDTMREYLPKPAFKAIISAKEKGTKIPREFADQVASAMKD